jgi:hypothetical protein
MKKTGRYVFSALLNARSPAMKGLLLPYLSKKEKEEFKKSPSRLFKDPSKGLDLSGKYLEYIHGSWMAPYLRTLPESDIRLVLSSVSEKKRTELKKILLFSNHFPQLSVHAKNFLQDHLYSKIKEGTDDLLPIECLPENPLNFILELENEELMRLVELLGLYDVAFDLRHVIETAKIKQIFAVLNPKERDFLQSLLQQKESIAFKRMGLDKWDGSVGYLKTLIEQRGLNRLAKALYGQEDSLLWYVTHKMDTAHAAALQKLCTDLNHPQGQAVLVRQITDIATLIKEKKL